MYQLFRHLFYDADGNEYEINQWSSMFGDANEEGDITYFYDEFPLKNYPWHLWMPATFFYNLSVFAGKLQEKVRKKAGKTAE